MNIEYFIRSFTNIAPNKAQIEKIENVREGFKSLLPILNANCPDSRELSVGLTQLETSLMYAVKSIILNDTSEEEKEPEVDCVKEIFAFNQPHIKIR